MLALVPLSNRRGISQSTSFRSQCPHWHSFPSPTYVGSHNTPSFGHWHSFPSPTYVGSHNTLSFGAQQPPWHSFLSPINVGSQNTPPSGLRVLAGTYSSLQPIWDLKIHPLLGPSVLVGTPPGVHSLCRYNPLVF